MLFACHMQANRMAWRRLPQNSGAPSPDRPPSPRPPTHVNTVLFSYHTQVVGWTGHHPKQLRRYIDMYKEMNITAVPFSEHKDIILWSVDSHGKPRTRARIMCGHRGASFTPFLPACAFTPYALQVLPAIVSRSRSESLDPSG